MNFKPNWVTHPGEHLAEHLERRGWTQAAFARKCGMTPKHVSEIVNGKAPVVARTALAFERVLGHPRAATWMALQAQYDLFHARKKKRRKPQGGK